MKNFLKIILACLILLGFLASISAFLGRDLLLNLKESLPRENQRTQSSSKKIISRFAVISDTHSDNEETQKATNQIKNLGVDYIIHTGDWTKVGTVDELQAQKKILQNSDSLYWGVMGDHDRWQSKAVNFQTVFGSTYESFDKNNLHHVLLDNSDLEQGFGKDQLDWFQADMEKNKNKPTIIFMHLPIYHPSSDRTIAAKGGVSNERNQETDRFLKIIKGKKVLAMFSGDHHLSSSYTEPKTSVRIFISGAVTRDRNLQTPRFSLVEVYDDFSLNVTDQIIN